MYLPPPREPVDLCPTLFILVVPSTHIPHEYLDMFVALHSRGDSPRDGYTEGRYAEEPSPLERLVRSPNFGVVEQYLFVFVKSMSSLCFTH